MEAGKLPPELLSRLLDKLNIRDPHVILGPRVGEDAAVIDIGDRYLVAKTDPITFATDLIGWYLVQINTNDLAVMGATPRWLMANLLFPENVGPETVERVFDQLIEACKAHDITLIGGHTEITYDLPRPMAIGAILGEVAKDRVVYTSGAQPGDAIVLTKGIAIEGTAIIAREAAKKLRQKGISLAVIRRAQNLLFSPGISVVKDASIARSTVEVHSMHDPTEGGIATGLKEIAECAGVGLMIHSCRIPILQECQVICQALSLDPLGLIASGALLATLAPEETPLLIEAFAKEGIPAYEIGRIGHAEEGIKIETDGNVRALPVFDRDELARFLSE